MNKEIISQVAYKGAIELINNGKVELEDLTKTVKAHTALIMSVASDGTADPKTTSEENSGTKLECPACGKSDWLQDNRQKKQNDPAKFGKIPNYSCSTYKDDNGCGYATYDEELAIANPF